MIQKVGIVGLGALGILFGQKLAEAMGKEQVYVIADEKRIDRYRKEGVYANGQRCDFTYVEPKDAPVVDLLIYATKYYSLEEAVKDSAGACGEDTIVISLLNGVSSEELIEKLIHPVHLLYCVAQGMDATREGTGLHIPKQVRWFLEKRITRRARVCACWRSCFKERISLMRFRRIFCINYGINGC